ncbi:ATP synthase F0 subcomplex A subunit [Actinomycetospora succinea]|uniref:ATP synthase subunit a n=1 Tax=Actinomycetospora succinea TaxID=663603 RepID=A0A4R6VRM0_9PSEU|nr:F0F1 ATP synthase subunit A [Actinomycetospora succinea]TDQ65227.1 ATP synthase F0 subcomplex A subunit [Actinomycetospora succinea]
MISSLLTQVPAPPVPPGTPAEGFKAPGVEDFNLPPIFEGVPVLEWVDKVSIQFIVAALIVWGFFALATKDPKVVPGRLQFLAEKFQGIVRDQIARDNIGPDFRKYVPYLVALFAFILVNNVFGILPFVQFPSFSHPGMAYALAAITWLIYNYVGIKKQGFGGYVQLMTWPPGVPGWVRVILTPIEFLSNFILRPVTLSLRLFGNMLAGHLLLLVFIFGGEYMLTVADDLVLNVLSPFAFLFAIVMTFFEAFIQVVQAYIFTVLTASYIGASLADEH